MNNFLNWFVILIAVGSFLACLWLIWWTSKPRRDEVAPGQEMGHVWDGDLEEYNNPLPRWWLWLFYITIAFGLIYMLLYPALGNFSGKLGWSQTEQYRQEMAQAESSYGVIFKRYASQSMEQLINDRDAMQSGQRLFINYCSTCHGSDAGGARGFPSLKDRDWLYGSDADAIKHSILQGRQGNMPPMKDALGNDSKVEEVAQYVLSLSGKETDQSKAQAGKSLFVVCAGCHGLEAKGNQAIGAPNLSDDIWLYGNTLEDIKTVIREGRSGKMPAHEGFLSPEKVHLLTAYIISLGQ